MFCTNCGKQFEGNFCPNCGTPAYSASAPVSATSAPVRPAEKKYPDPPLGTYSNSFCPLISVGFNSIIIEKINAEDKKYFDSRIEIYYSDIAIVMIDDREKVTSVSIRTKENCNIPFVDDMYVLSDPYCAIFRNDRENAYRTYEFLKKVAEINAYYVPKDSCFPEGFKFKNLYNDNSAAKIMLRPTTPKERIRENKANGIACCPKCGSTSLSAGKGGFSLGKAAVGSLVAWPVGLAAGALGSGKTVVTCLNCGHKWKP